jgi:hypothetical protein
MSRRVIALLALAALVALPAAAADVRVVSPRPDSVSVTIYRDLVALVTETRSVDLPAGDVTLVFEGVVDTLIPQSAVVRGADRPVAEANYDYERLTPANLMAKSIGRQVWLTRTNRATGQVRQVAATLVAANTSGVLFRTAEGNEALHCSGLPERLTFEELPGELQARPTLSIRLAPGTPGRRDVRVSYVAQGLAWSADYIGRLSAAGDRMNLAGWLTIENLTGASFRGAEVQVVAGKLHVIDSEYHRGSGPFGTTGGIEADESLDGIREDALEEMREEREAGTEGVQYFNGCYPLGPADYSALDLGRFPDMNVAEALQRVAGIEGTEELEEVTIIGTQASMSTRENLADYQMYRLPERTDLGARQTKQVAFLAKPDVTIERFYGLRLAGNEEDLGELEEGIPAIVKLGWRNSARNGLGEPLPAGMARFFERVGDGEVFVGDARLRDSPVDTPIEVGIGRSNDLELRIDNVEQSDVSLGSIDAGAKELALVLLTRRAYIPLRLRVVNAKPYPVLFELRQGRLDEEFLDLRVKNASLAPARKAGDYMWRLAVPANGEAMLSYEVGGKVEIFRDED